MTEVEATLYYLKLKVGRSVRVKTTGILRRLLARMRSPKSPLIADVLSDQNVLGSVPSGTSSVKWLERVLRAHLDNNQLSPRTPRPLQASQQDPGAPQVGGVAFFRRPGAERRQRFLSLLGTAVLKGLGAEVVEGVPEPR